MVQQQKQILREQVIAKRNSLDLDDIMEKSAIIKEKLFALKEFQDAETIMFYSSFKSEVRTMEMVEEALALGKKIVMPITLFKENKLKLVKITSSAGLKQNKAGIPEPISENNEEVNPSQLDLIVAPGTAFTEDCKRLGQGWGFFDTLFSQTTANRLGLAFEIQMVEDIPMEEHDQQLDIIVSENDIFRKNI
jgi:5-formyltetrahydrofolate cyclo-ligase